MEKEEPNHVAKKASTADVLGVAFGQTNVDPRWEDAYGALVKARDAIANRQKDLLTQASEENTPRSRNMADLGTDQYDRDWALGMASTEQETLYEIEQALSRIKNGTYGICEATGKPIEPDRLAAIPWARFSAEAEHHLEAEQKVTRARLGERQQVPKRAATQPTDEL
jgi:RNA polymerase-binding transcription factor DksA